MGVWGRQVSQEGLAIGERYGIRNTRCVLEKQLEWHGFQARAV